MKRLSLLALILSFCFFGMAGTAAAHELATVGTLSAVLHVEPDDHVVSGTSSPYEIEFDDLSGAFKPANCDCLLAARWNGKTVATDRPEVVSAQKSEGTIVFPKAGDYQMVLTGKPKAGASFANFTMTFPAQVSAPKTGLSSIAFWIGGAVILAAVLIAGALIIHRTKRLHHEIVE